jgi:octaprenyl-diphosphate synthase
LSVLDNDIRPYALQSALAGGKRIRPLLVFHFAGRSVVLDDSTIKASVILEIVHLASLIHDDILDGAEIRRNLPSMHEKIGSHAAVLLGDALFGFALELASQFPTTRICSIVSEATRKTCSGEIRQTFARGRPDLSLDEYLSFINDKTGELFRASCQIGAYLSGAKQDTINLAGEFGLSLGINYQVFDDLIDSFEDPGNSDKSLGSDWETGKMTLPVILLREVASVDEIKILDQLIRSGRDNNPEKNIRSQILELFEKYEILPNCIQYFEESFSRTQSLIDQFPNTHLRDDLNAFIQSFTLKFTKLTNLKTSNFLAL